MLLLTMLLIMIIRLGEWHYRYNVIYIMLLEECYRYNVIDRMLLLTMLLMMALSI